MLVSLVNRMDQGFFEHEICCVSGGGPMEHRLRAGIRVHSMEKGNAADRLMALKIANILRRSRPDLVHTYNWGGVDGILAAKLASPCGGIRVVHAEHGRDSADPEGKNKKRNVARKLLSPLVDRFIAVSADLDSWLVRQIKIPSAKVVRIVNGVDTELYQAGKADGLRKELGLQPNELVIGFVGRLDSVKDVGILIQAVLRLGEPFRLVITGDGPERMNLERLAGGNGRIIFLGERKDVAAVYKAIDIFALSSIAEGTPCTIQEAMASGLPAVATGVGGIPALIEDGRSGFLFSPGDIDAAVSCFSNYRQNPGLIQKHGQHGRRKAVQEFSLDKMTRSYQTLYLTLAGRCQCAE